LSSPLFTPRSAREALRALRPTLTDALRLYRALEGRAPEPGAECPVDLAYFAGVRRLLEALARVRDTGAELDLRRGRLRFPARRAGSDVVLSWELGEPHVLWHEAPPRRRTPAEDDGAWEEPG
jgi:hypothetical protein